MDQTFTLFIIFNKKLIAWCQIYTFIPQHSKIFAMLINGFLRAS